MINNTNFGSVLGAFLKRTNLSNSRSVNGSSLGINEEGVSLYLYDSIEVLFISP